jgi:hypothetical protein
MPLYTPSQSVTPPPGISSAAGTTPAGQLRGASVSFDDLRSALVCGRPDRLVNLTSALVFSNGQVTPTAEEAQLSRNSVAAQGLLGRTGEGGDRGEASAVVLEVLSLLAVLAQKYEYRLSLADFTCFTSTNVRNEY